MNNIELCVCRSLQITKNVAPTDSVEWQVTFEEGPKSLFCQFCPANSVLH